MMNVYERFWSHVQFTDTCWLWTSPLTREGYARLFTVDGQRMFAHRLVYLMAHGDLPPKGLTIDHLCRIRHCVNYRHLEAVTGKVNVLRGESFSAVNARKALCLRGHELEPKGSTRYCRTCHSTSNRKWRARNREAVQVNNRAYRARNLEAIRARSREWMRAYRVKKEG